MCTVQWMTYWIVFSMVTVCEEFIDGVFGLLVPFYYVFKIIFIIWLVSPTTRGSAFIYTKIVHPVLVRNEAEIDERLAIMKENLINLCVK